MKPIASTFKSDGFDFKLLKREGMVALFEKTKPHYHHPLHEVVIIQERPEVTIKGRLVEAHEAMPASEDWGWRGWSPIGIERALEKFAEVVADQKVTIVGVLPPSKAKSATLIGK